MDNTKAQDKVRTKHRKMPYEAQDKVRTKHRKMPYKAKDPTQKTKQISNTHPTRTPTHELSKSICM